MVAVGAYLLLEPALEARLGFDLPGVNAPNGGVAESETSPAKPTPLVDHGQGDDGQGSGGQVDIDQINSGQGELARLLKQVGRDRFESPAGIIYTPGSQQGHRLKHLMAHARDQPGRPGQHGVFDAKEAVAVVRLVDEAYEQALAGRRTKRSNESGGRTVYTVDLGRPIGTIGGQSGGRRGHPTARHVRLVLEGKRFITAFPVIP